MVLYGPVWYLMVPYGPSWPPMDPYGPVWSLMAPYGPVWFHMVPCGPSLLAANFGHKIFLHYSSESNFSTIFASL